MSLKLFVISILFVSTGFNINGKSREYDKYIKAERIFERGSLFFKLKNYEKALESYKKACEIFKDEKYYLAIAKVYDVLKNYEKAIYYYQQYLKFGVLADRAEEVKKRIEEIKEETNFGKELVSIKVFPPDADVFLDDVSPYTRLKIPYEGFVSWGKHKLIIKKEDYKEKIVPFTVKKGKSLSLSFKLERLLYTVKVTIKSIPEGAKLYIDDKYIGETPISVTVNEGYYNLKLVHDDYPKYEKVVQFYRKMRRELVFNLKKKEKKEETKGLLAKKIFESSGGKKGAVIVVKKKGTVFKTLGLISMGVGFLSVATGGIFTYFALNEVSKAESLDPEKLKSKYDEAFDLKIDYAKKNLKFANIFYASGAVLITTGITFIIINKFAGKKKSKITVMPDFYNKKGLVINYHF